MRTIVVTAFVVICLVSITAYAGEKAPYQEKAELFLTTVIEGQVEEAYDVLFKGSLIETKKQQVDLAKKQTAVGITMYGKLLGFEFIKQDSYGNSIVRLVYVMKAEQHPLTWQFYFYKPKTEWILSDILFNDQFDLLVDK